MRHFDLNRWTAKDVARLLALVETERRYYQDIIAKLPVGLAVVSPELVILLANRSFRETLGLSRAEMADRRLDDLLRDADLRTRVRSVLDTGVADLHSALSFGDRLLRVSLLPFRGWQDEEQSEVLVSLEDVTGMLPAEGAPSSPQPNIEALQRAWRRRAQREKSEALGRFASRLAHDYNNLLSIVTGYTDEVFSGLPQDSPIRGDLKEVLDAAGRLSMLTQNVLAYGRRPTLQLTSLDLNLSVSNLKDSLKREAGPNLEVSLELAPGTLPVKVDAASLEQVLKALVGRARDVMPGGGRVSIRTAVCGGMAILELLDAGPVLPEESRQTMFEPFAGKISAGEGRLGLAAVEPLIYQNDGEYEIREVEGGGTAIRLLFPISAEPVESTSAATAPQAAPQLETVLVVEDETAVRALLRKILGRQGYRVLEASNGEEAIRLATESSEPIHLLLTDIMMPGLSGADIADRLRSVREGLKVLFISGFTGEIALHPETLPPGAGFLAKPFTMRALLEKVREVLNA